MLKQIGNLARHVGSVDDHARAHVVGHRHVRREARDFAASAGDGDVCTDRAHARTRDVAAIDRIAQRNVCEGSEATHVVDAGEAGVQCFTRVARSQQGDFSDGVQQRLSRIVGLVHVGQVDVHVDQAGQHVISGPIDQRGALGRCGVRGHRKDDPILDPNQPVTQHHAVFGVDQGAGAHIQHRRRRRHGGCREQGAQCAEKTSPGNPHRQSLLNDCIKSGEV